MKEDQELLRGDGGIDAKLSVKQEWGGRIMHGECCLKQALRLLLCQKPSDFS